MQCLAAIITAKKKKVVPLQLVFSDFQKTKKMCSVWIQMCHRSDQFNVDNARVCSLHFSDNCFARNLRAELLNTSNPKKNLKDGTTPDINFPLQKPSSSSSINREQRAIKKSC